MTKQINDEFQIRSLAEAKRSLDDGACGWGAPMTEQGVEHFKIRSVSDGSAWGWGPTRTK